jgi:uncharacterized protein YjiK
LRSIIFVFLAGFFTACSGESQSAAESRADGIKQWALPDKLREISGLALTSDGRLLAVTDETAIVYELDFETGKLVKAFAFGEPVVNGDFEGIAVLDDMVWLMTSDGQLYQASEGDDGQQLDYRHYDTNLEDDCEFEGLAEIPQRQSLALLCKNPNKGKKLRLYEWRAENDGLERTSDFTLPEKAMASAVDEKRVNPSGITLDPETGNWIVIAARQHAVFELNVEGALIDVILRLDPDRHQQAEGIAITGDGRLIIADEAGKGRARLSVYPMKTWNNKN